MDLRKHYKILEIDHPASLEEARQAYRDLIAVWHPDRYTHNPRLQKKALEKVKAVNAAFEIVSRFILESGPGKENPADEKSSPAHGKIRDIHRTGKDENRAAVWEKTEARLAALARAKEIADARKAARDREAAGLAAAKEKREAAARQDRLKAERQSQNRGKETTQNARLEKKLARERAWAETEQKLQALKLAREKAALDRAAGLSRYVENRELLGWYVKQVLICSAILLVAFSGNALQSFIHINFEAMLVIFSTGCLAWWGVTRIKRSRRLKK